MKEKFFFFFRRSKNCILLFFINLETVMICFSDENDLLCYCLHAHPKDQHKEQKHTLVS